MYVLLAGQTATRASSALGRKSIYTDSTALINRTSMRYFASFFLPALAIAGPPPQTFTDWFQPQGFGYKGERGDKGKAGKDVAVARAYNISDPVFTCPKPGYELIGEDCVFVDTVQARFECPIGYVPEGGTPGRPDNCVRTTNPVATCPQGRLVNGVCQIASYSEPVTSCPTGSVENPDGTCNRFEPVNPVERCPEGSDRINGQCVRIQYTEPAYICPHDTVQENKKCRREVVTFKTKGRALSEVEGFLSKNEDEVELDESDFDLFADLPDHVFQLEEGMEGEGGCNGGECKAMPKATWLPAYVTKPTKPPKVIYTEALKWQKIHVQVPVMVSQKNTPAPKPPKVIKEKEPKPAKVKVVKAPPPPQKVIKVQYIPAEKVCHEGEKHGGACVSQIPVSPVTECPVPLVNGICQRVIPVTPTTVCLVGSLVCPPRVPGTRCQCETITETSPVLSCPTGIFDPITETCISEALPKEYCPLGYFLDPNNDTCTKRDVEAAICIFSVTYLCPDCDKY